MNKANAEGWAQERSKVESKALAKAEQRVANAAAENAVLVERAKKLALERVVKALERMPDNGGSHVRQQITDGGKRMVVDHDLLSLIAALEKLEQGKVDNDKEDKVTVIVDV